MRGDRQTPFPPEVEPRLQARVPGCGLNALKLCAELIGEKSSLLLEDGNRQSVW